MEVYMWVIKKWIFAYSIKNQSMRGLLFLAALII